MVLELATPPEGATRADFAAAAGNSTTLPWTMIVKDAAKRFGLDWEITKAMRKNYRVGRGRLSKPIGEGDSGADADTANSRDDRHISDSRTVHGG